MAVTVRICFPSPRCRLHDELFPLPYARLWVPTSPAPPVALEEGRNQDVETWFLQKMSLSRACFGLFLLPATCAAPRLASCRVRGSHMCRVPSWGRDETSSQTQEQLPLAVASRLELVLGLHLPLFALLGTHRPFSPSLCAKVACRRIAQQHRNIGISSFLCKKKKIFRKTSWKGFLFSFFFFFSER